MRCLFEGVVYWGLYCGSYHHIGIDLGRASPFMENPPYLQPVDRKPLQQARYRQLSTRCTHMYGFSKNKRGPNVVPNFLQP